MHWSPTKLHRNFGVTFCLHSEGKTVNQATDQNEAIRNPVSCVEQYSALKMEPIYTTRNTCLRTTRRYNPQVCDLHNNCHVKLKSKKSNTWCRNSEQSIVNIVWRGA
jgi:hypothetical protein